MKMYKYIGCEGNIEINRYLNNELIKSNKSRDRWFKLGMINMLINTCWVSYMIGEVFFS